MSADLSFWARRRAAVQAEAEAELRATRDAEAQARAVALAEKDDAQVLEEMGLPEPSGMQSGDDFAAFMARDVPEHLRRQALRTLWRSNPVLACVDGLNEYDDDYRAAMLLSAPVKTAYQVGKGMLKHVEEMERKAEAERVVLEEEITEEAAPEAVEEDGPDAAVTADAPVETDQRPESAPTYAASTEEAAPAPRRMRFRFEEAAV